MLTKLSTLPIIAASCAAFTVLLSATVVAQPVGAPQQSQATLISPQGDPLSGAGVYAVIPMMTRAVQAAGTTDDAGNFLVPPNATGVIVVPVHGATTFFAVTKDGKRLANLPENEYRAAIAKATQITIRVIDDRSRPMRNAVVTVFPTDDGRQITGEVVGGDAPNLPASLMGRLTGHTDRTGSVTFTDLPQGGRISVTMQQDPSRGALALGGGISLAASPISPTATIRVPFDRIIAGRVTYRATGKPVPNAAVSLLGPGYHNWLGSARTDNSGRYRFMGLPPARYGLMMFNPADLHAVNLKRGEFQYCAVQRSRNGEWRNPGSAVIASVVNSKTASDIDFELVEMAAVDGKCVGANGRPVPNAAVMAELPDGSGEGHPADAHGHFHFRLPPGRVHLTWARAAGKPSQSGPAFTLREGESKMVTLKDKTSGALPPRRR